MSPNPISDFNLQADYGDLIKSRASRYNPEVIREVIQRSIDLHRNDPEADDGDIIKSGEDPYDPKVSELMIQRCVDIISDVEGDDCVRPDPSKPLPEGYTMASFAYCGRKNGVPVPIGPPVTAVLMDCIVCGQGGLHWPPDCPLKGTEEYYRNLAEICPDLESKLHG
ncbi:hypothetical protein M0R45_013885 [Rubus argutus]|uniref:Uncharacterized protein n=1 Tax=Rubus argutus TaxID=59490 RepID=A0AAW1XL27_RUBAR